MLVLSRQRDESIMIGDNIVVTIVDIRGDKVRLGINAPSEIPVHRQEVYEAIDRRVVGRELLLVLVTDKLAGLVHVGQALSPPQRIQLGPIWLGGRPIGRHHCKSLLN